MIMAGLPCILKLLEFIALVGLLAWGTFELARYKISLISSNDFLLKKSSSLFSLYNNLLSLYKLNLKKTILPYICSHSLL